MPPVLPPPGLRRYLGFTKLSPATVNAVARLIDRDDKFRGRVAAAVDEAAVGRAGWLWLTRPDGWEAEFDQLAEAAAEDAAAATEARDEREARRRLAAARTAAEKATAMAIARQQEAADARAELEEELARRRQLEERVAELDAALNRARQERATAVRQLKQVEAKLARRAAEAKAATARLRELEQRLATSPPPPDLPPGPRGDPAAAAVAEAVDAAAEQAARLVGALGELRQAVAASLDPSGVPPAAATAADELGEVPAPQALTLPAASGPRRAAPLPGGIHDDSVEAVEYLLRLPGAWLLVDGYNVSMEGWPDLSVAEQRRRLVSALGEAASRTGAAVEVVFDGAADDPVPVPRSARRLVRVRFSPSHVEADDVLLDLVGQLPPTRPVVVASSDNRVREGARRLGANLLHARQLVAALRR